MGEANASGPRPLKVFVKPGSKAELICRRYAARAKVEAKQQPPHAEIIAAGSRPRPELDLQDRGGKVIPGLTYTNFFIGKGSWRAQDLKNIDTNLERAMSDPHLNNVLLQYFRGAMKISSTFRQSTLLRGDAPSFNVAAGNREAASNIAYTGKVERL